MNVLTRLGLAVKQFRMRWGPARTWGWGLLGATRHDYAGEVHGPSNAAAAAVVGWIATTFPEAPPRIRAKKSNGDLEPIVDHPMIARLERPNPYYSGALLWAATLSDYEFTGDAYWAKVRSAADRVAELWWLPARTVEPMVDTNSRAFVDYYAYRVDGDEIRIRPEDMVHFRRGLDPANPRKGLSPLAALAREVATDDAAANWSASLLRNMGMPGLVISPDAGISLTQEEAERAKVEVHQRFGGDNRGQPLVMAGATKVQMLSFSPEQMSLKDLRRIPEERISAVYGVPAIVAGLGAGLDRSTFANYAEAREAAYEQCVIPTQRLLAAELRTQLLVDYVGEDALDRYVVDFDLSDVRVLQPDLDKLYARLDVAVRGGWMMPNEARQEIGLEPLPGGDVIYVPSSLTPTDPAELIPPEPEPEEMLALPPGNTEPAAEEPEEAEKILALPNRKARKAVARNLADAVTRIRTRHEGPLAREIGGHLARMAGVHASQAKALTEDDALRTILEKWYARTLTAVHVAVQQAFGAAFGLEDPLVRAYLLEAGGAIAGIDETTREAVASALREGHAAGEGVEQIAKRIRGLAAFSPSRARTIARTELGQAANLAALTSYRASGLVVGVEVFDGDGCGLRSHDDPEKAHGRRLTLEEAADVPRLAHPSCRRAFGPIVDPAEMEAVA